MTGADTSDESDRSPGSSSSSGVVEPGEHGATHASTGRVHASSDGGVALVAHLAYYRHAAEALAEAGLLEAFLTAPVAARSLPGERLPVVGAGVKAFNALRVDSALSDLPLRRLWVAQAMALGAQRVAMRTGHGTALPLRARVWDAAVTARLGTPSVVHVVSELAGWCTAAARRRGALVVVDVRAAHPRAQIASVAPFLARRGLAYRLPEAALLGRLERAFADADLIVCNSEYTRRTFLDQGLPDERVVAVPLGCDVERFRPVGGSPERPGPFTVLFVGRERHAKGVLDLADAVRALPASSRVVLSGDPDPVTAQAFAGARAEVTFAGPVVSDGLARLYREASVLALPSYSEGFGMVVLEAMASGMPVVVSDRVGAADAVRAAEAGFVVPAGDADALADALVALERDPGRVATLGLAARRLAEQHPWQAYGDRLVAVYRERVLPRRA